MGITDDKPVDFLEGYAPYRNLACAVVIQAIEDWQADKKKLKKKGKKSRAGRAASEDMKGIMEFLNSGILEKLGISRDLVISNIDTMEIPMERDMDSWKWRFLRA